MSARMKTLVVAIAGWLIVGMVAGMPAAKAATGTSVTVTSTPNPATSGDTVTFTAVVTAADGSIPTGSVWFKSQYTYEVDATRSLDSAGRATFSTPMWYGPRTVTASYSGDGTHSAASASLVQNVLSETTTSLSSTKNPSTPGEEVTFIASISGGDNPTGSVTFTDGSQTLGTVPVVNYQATYTTASLPAGPHAIAASYAGDAATAGSSAGLTQNVRSSAGLAVASSLNPAISGQSVTWQATVATAPGRPTPTGAVTFTDQYGSYWAQRSLDGSGTATYTTTAYGSRTITANYSGDANYAASTTTLAQTVLTATSVSLSSSGNPTDPGRQVTFTAVVSGSSPTGSVTFSDGPERLAVVAVSNSQATYSTTTLAPGAHVITASYSGDSQNGASSATKSHAVNVPTGGGYWMLGTGGEVFAFGGAPDLGGADVDAADIEPTPSGRGYWILGADGSVTPKGDATYFGRGWVGSYDYEFAASISSTPDGQGYWIFTSDGRAIPFGNAAFFGDMEGTSLNGSILDSVVTKSGHGYWMVGSDGGIFAFGDAKFFGSTGNLRLNQPVMSMVADPDGAGYWLVASDGGIFAFDAPFYGSMGGTRLNKPVSAMVGSPAGYLMVGQDGGIFAFGATAFYGSLGARPPANPIIAVALKPANT